MFIPLHNFPGVKTILTEISTFHHGLLIWYCIRLWSFIKYAPFSFVGHFLSKLASPSSFPVLSGETHHSPNNFQCEFSRISPLKWIDSVFIPFWNFPGLKTFFDEISIFHHGLIGCSFSYQLWRNFFLNIFINRLKNVLFVTGLYRGCFFRKKISQGYKTPISIPNTSEREKKISNFFMDKLVTFSSKRSFRYRII